MDTQGDSFFVAFRSAPDAVAAAVDDPALARRARVAGGRRGARADRYPHRARRRRRGAVRRPLGASGGPGRRVGARRSGARVGFDPGRWSRTTCPTGVFAPRSGRSPVEGHRPAGADLAARGRRAAGGVPAAAGRGAGQADADPSAPLAAGGGAGRCGRGGGRDPGVRDQAAARAAPRRSRVSMRTRSARSTPRTASSSASVPVGTARARSRSVRARSG